MPCPRFRSRVRQSERSRTAGRIVGRAAQAWLRLTLRASASNCQPAVRCPECPSEYWSWRRPEGRGMCQCRRNQSREPRREFGWRTGYRFHLLRLVTCHWHVSAALSWRRGWGRRQFHRWADRCRSALRRRLSVRITLLTEITLLADNGFQQVGVERSKLGRHLRSRRRLFRQLRDMFQLIGFRSHGGWSNECISRGNRLKARRACSRVVGVVVFVRPTCRHHLR